MVCVICYLYAYVHMCSVCVCVCVCVCLCVCVCMCVGWFEPSVVTDAWGFFWQYELKLQTINQITDRSIKANSKDIDLDICSVCHLSSFELESIGLAEIFLLYVEYYKTL